MDGPLRHRNLGLWHVFSVDVRKKAGVFVIGASDWMLQDEYQNQLSGFLGGSALRGLLEQAKGKALKIWLDPNDRTVSHAIEDLPFAPRGALVPDS